MRIHADDFGITEQQARAILALCNTDDHAGAINSVSVFVNTPHFESTTTMLKPAILSGKLSVSLHINLVEGYPCAPADTIPLLLDDKGAFAHNFIGLLRLSYGLRRAQLYDQLLKECSAQIHRFLQVFPDQQRSLCIDTHQHTHAIPLVFDALLDSLSLCKCTLSRIRIPIEDISLYKKCGLQKQISKENRLKILLINLLCRNAQQKLPNDCAVPLFCGIGFSGEMYKITDDLINELRRKGAEQERDVELLFHPVSVPLEECLDPSNKPFAQACASRNRDKEAQRIELMKQDQASAFRSTNS